MFPYGLVREFLEAELTALKREAKPMTRDEAVKKLEVSWAAVLQVSPNCSSHLQFVTALEALGLLHLDPAIAGTEDKVRIAAASRLEGVIVYVTHSRQGGYSAVKEPGKITPDGALEILDVLTKSGFRITRE